MAVQRRVVEQHARDDERAGERSPPRLVGTRDEADAETAVVAEEALARWRAHRPEDIGRPGTRSCRLCADFVPRRRERAQNGSTQPALRSSSTTSQPAFFSVARYQSQPPSRSFAAQTKTVVSRSTNQADGLSVQRVFATSYRDAESVVLDRDPGARLARRLGPAAREQQDAGEQQGEPGESAWAATLAQGYDWRSSRMRAFLPTRPRR